MRVVLLGVAASIAGIALPAAPATAQSGTAGAFVGVPAHPSDRFSGSPFVHRDGDRRDRRRHNDSNGDVFIGEWPQQGDTAWRSDSFNDWWHDRPDRAFPRWVQSGKCERPWWSGNILRC
jgi:hypothetical protein